MRVGVWRIAVPSYRWIGFSWRPDAIAAMKQFSEALSWLGDASKSKCFGALVPEGLDAHRIEGSDEGQSDADVGYKYSSHNISAVEVEPPGPPLVLKSERIRPSEIIRTY
jgi:hypothetical protein